MRRCGADVETYVRCSRCEHVRHPEKNGDTCTLCGGRLELLEPEWRVLVCPTCLKPHVDRDGWEARPHRVHLCQNTCDGTSGCGHTWRTADVPTRGVPWIGVFKAVREADGWHTESEPVDGDSAGRAELGDVMLRLEAKDFVMAVRIRSIKPKDGAFQARDDSYFVVDSDGSRVFSSRPDSAVEGVGSSLCFFPELYPVGTRVVVHEPLI